MWLYYWMAANGIDPMKDAKVITVPPPQMGANMRVGVKFRVKERGERQKLGAAAFRC